MGIPNDDDGGQSEATFAQSRALPHEERGGQMGHSRALWVALGLGLLLLPLLLLLLRTALAPVPPVAAVLLALIGLVVAWLVGIAWLRSTIRRARQQEPRTIERAPDPRWPPGR